jgi:putative ABC transport system permease protein
MFKNYLKIALRNFRKYKAYSVINIAGLASGIACCILILLYVQGELSYDRFHDKADRIYRVITDEESEGQVRHLAHTYGPLAPALLTDFPEIEHAVRLFPHNLAVQLGAQKSFHEERFFFADSAVFEVFSYGFKRGNPKTALRAPYSLVLTEATAQRYFGDENPIGKVLRIEGQYDFNVTAVLENPPPTSHFHFDFLASMENVPQVLGWDPHWHWPPFYNYVLLPEHVSAESIESRFPQFIAKNIGRDAVDSRSFHLQPLKDIHLNARLESEIAPTGNMAYIYLFSAIAFFILLIACINFMNLATARSANRSREVGLRKVVGAQRAQLIKQFLGESLFYSFLAMLFALVLVEMLLPRFNQLLGKQIDVNYFENWGLSLGLIVLAFLVGIISGSYPAIFMSSFRPLKVLQGKLFSASGQRSALRFRSVLVVTQFAISIALIIVTYVVSGQLNFIQNKRLGFNKEHIVVIPIRDAETQNNYEILKNALVAQPDVLDAAVLSNFPWQSGFYDFPVHAEGMREDAELNFPVLLVDHDFVRTFGMEVVEGRDFAKEFTTDKGGAFLLNETAVQNFGWDSALGKKLTMKHIASGDDVAGRVIGVVKDFHFRSLHHEIEPLAILIAPAEYYVDNMAVRIDGQNISAALASLEQKWREFVPSRPFLYFFLDEDFDALYRKEEKLSSIFQGFATLAIFIACLGLFGLASFSAEQRRKEIGIRKTLGATVQNIAFLLSKEFTKLTVVANVIAWPLAFFIMKDWLQNFAYRIDLSLMTFVVSGIIALSIALLTVSYQAIKAALTNPVEALRYE